MPVAALLALPALNVKAQQTIVEWASPTSADFNVAGNWLPNGVPNVNNNVCNDLGSNDVVLVNAGDPTWNTWDLRAANSNNATGSYLINGSTVNAGGWVRLGIGTGSTGYLTISNGILNANNGRFNIGELGVGVLNIAGGAINFNTGNQMALADGPVGSMGTVNQTGGTNISNGELWVGNNAGVGAYNLSGGSISVNNWMVVGRAQNGGSAYGMITMTGGTFNQTGGNRFLVGSETSGSSVGFFIQSGGTLNVQNQYLVPEQGASAVGSNSISGTAVINAHDWVAIGRNSGHGELDITGNASFTRDNANDSGANFDVGGGGPGVVNQNGGAITNLAGQTWLSESSSAVWNMNSGIAAMGPVVMSKGSANSTLNLNGGLFQVSGINGGGGNGVSAINFNGSIVQATGANANFLSGIGIAQMGTGGVTLDSQGFNLGIPQEIDDSGGGTFTKIGSGTVTLSGPNTFGGNTVVSQGALAVSSASSGGGSYSIASGASLTVLVSNSLNSALNASSVTFGGGNNLTINLAAFGNPTAAPLNAGALTVSGTVTLNVLDAAPATGQVPLIHYSSLTGPGSFVLGTLPNGELATLSNNVANSSIDLVVTRALGAPRWNGNVAGGVWDINTTPNWVDIATLSPTVYADGSAVLLDDNATTSTINLTANVSPGSVTVNNSSLPYTITGTGKIGGSTGLLKEGTSTLAILNTGGNSYTGPTVLLNGSLTVSNLANGGSPSAIGAATSSATNLVIDAASFIYTGPTVTANRGFTIGDTNTTIDAEGNLNLGGPITNVVNVAEGGAAFTKVGPAQLTLSGSGDKEFSTGYAAGMDVINGTLVLDGTSGNQTNHTQNQIWVGSTPNSGAALILTNTLFRVDDWLGLGRINGGINNTSSVTLYNSTMTVGNLSLGWDGGQPNNLSSQFITLNGSSVFTNYGNVNLAEGANASFTMNINDTSEFWIQNPCYIALASPSTGAVVVASSGKLIQVGGWFDIAQGNNSMGSLLVKNTGFVSLDGDLNITDTGTGSTASATVQDNAKLVANNLWIGKATGAIATFTITNNAVVYSTNGLTLATHFDGTPEACSATMNLSGGSIAVNLVQGNIVSGTNYGVFNFNGGKLIAHGPYFGANFMYTLAAINDLAGGAVVEIDNSDATAIAQAILGGNGDGGFTKLGTGTLYLNAVNTYTNTTTVSGGTLGGTGTIAGPVNVAASGTLTAGAGAIGTFSINNKLTFAPGSTSFMKITPASNDQIAGLTSVTYSGALVVTNTSGTSLTGGAVYKLFNSASPGTGSFSSITVLPAGSATFNPTTGELTIGATAAPVITSTKFSGGNLTLSGTGGAAGANYSVLTTTNIATPLSAWTTNTSGAFSATGTFTNVIPVNLSTPAQFFRIH